MDLVEAVETVAAGALGRSEGPQNVNQADRNDGADDASAMSMSPAGFVPACAGCDPPAPPGARKAVRRERCSKRWNALARTYPERSRGLDSPLGIAGALVLEGACTAGASSR